MSIAQVVKYCTLPNTDQETHLVIGLSAALFLGTERFNSTNGSMSSAAFCVGPVDSTQLNSTGTRVKVQSHA